MFDTHEYVLCINILIYISFTFFFVLFAWFAVVTLVTKIIIKPTLSSLSLDIDVESTFIIVWELSVFWIFWGGFNGGFCAEY